METLNVAIEVAVLCKRLGALLACIGATGNVQVKMRRQCAYLGKGFVAQITSILFPSVNAHVQLQCFVFGKALRTNRAGEWFLASVHALMASEVAVLGEFLVAMRTFVRLLP